MKKKTLISSVIAIFIIVIALITLTNMFTKGVITGKLYLVDNVYEEIWNMVNSEKNGIHTILTTSIDGSEVVYELGCFEKVSIPVNDEHLVFLCFHQNEFNQDELSIWLLEYNGSNYDTLLYVYNYQTNTLYGDQEESHLIDQFMSKYYLWVGNDGKFNSENPGDYTFVLTEYPFSHK